MPTPRPDAASAASLLWRTVRSWDIVAGLVAAATFVGITSAGNKFEGDRALLLATVPLGLGISTAAWVAGRWVSDRMKDDEYGEMVRLLDPRESALSLPYYVTTFAGLVTSAAAILGAIVVNDIETTGPLIAIYAAVLGTAVWSLLGLGALVLISARHQRRAAEIRSMKEELAALARDQQQGSGSDDGAADE